MTPEDVIDVLSKAGAYDNRTIGHVEVAAWHEVIGRYERADALEAVARHYTETRERMMPADLIKQIKAVREDRRREQHSDALALPSRWEEDPDRDERIAKAKERLYREVLGPLAEKRAADRALREEQTTAAIEAMRIHLGGAEWQRNPNAKLGAWWEDEAARERHACQLLAANGTLYPPPINDDNAQPIDDKETTRS